MKTLRVLVVEDLEPNRALAARLVVELGHQVMAVEHGALAVARCREDVFDVILLDAQMPVMDGFEAYERLRALPQASRTAIISWSAGFRIPGCDAYLAKPCHLVELRRALEEAMLTRSAAEA